MSMEEAIRNAVLKEVERISAEEAAACAKIVERRVRERSVEIAATICRRMSMEPWGKDELKIIVQFP